ncbi:hypothetical protein VV01_17955 [Luteipulveratus halotolerans]|uniref:DUF2752 domain-containing protein n=1 Tax=Luteipulveratus halotolerans TaxID=1631356 RepID=A0A0L6CPX4_9MICO|nr:hypothetical protein VV01_17955 [Luteipulveratus halotolerans]
MTAWWAGGLIAAVTAAAVLPPAAAGSGPVLCPFRRLTGLPCPGCGLTRSWVDTAHGHLGSAFELNPFGPITFALAVAAVLMVLLRRPWPTVSGRLAVVVGVLAGVALAAWGITRMVLVARGEWSGPY